jgi:hypothetical protein
MNKRNMTKNGMCTKCNESHKVYYYNNAFDTGYVCFCRACALEKGYNLSKSMK